MTPAELRRLNLIEVLSEEAEARGRTAPEPPEDAALTWWALPA
jgi:hypothetical protein